ncbi:hypothetical protein M404DRAFT_325174 [Pisolithus tinctorius Marx 270]|uniref:Uncharacterized protein n=1 Tax=Pisolithus tinctorius Marx 270 TaxID=870435 RepID=A0A0C3JI46_PISTI|nr:hypothetical protein M404DRAFT_325174 [Pisolithus tinctorius Marx 270]
MRIVCHAITFDPEFYVAWSSIDGRFVELCFPEHVKELQGLKGKFVSVILFERFLCNALCNESNEKLGKCVLADSGYKRLTRVWIENVCWKQKEVPRCYTNHVSSLRYR